MPEETPEITPTTDAPKSPSRTRRLAIRALKGLLVVAGLWLLAAYVILPALWRHYEHHPILEEAPKTTLTSQGIPGDALNVGLIGEEADVVSQMHRAGWYPADPVTLKSSIKIAGSVLRDTPYKDAPVSPLFVFGHKQDLAFEKPAGVSASHRHHVRFWKSIELGQNGVPFWIGAITFDKSVGLSHTTGQITHHIGPDIDAERDLLMADLRKVHALTKIYEVTGVGATLLGRNGGGDPYYTDGELAVGVLAKAGQAEAEASVLDNPPSVQLKDQLWSAIRPMLQTVSGSNPQDDAK